MRQRGPYEELDVLNDEVTTNMSITARVEEVKVSQHIHEPSEYNTFGTLRETISTRPPQIHY
eukprot:6473752-Amphidinium_carterae.2